MQNSKLVRGAAFVDRFLPLDSHGKLRSDVWGAANVIPRDVDNGIEDSIYSYWGGNIILGEEGKYHLFVARWREDNSRPNGKSGHVLWWDSEVAHAVCDQPSGPYKVVDVVGKGHNPEIYKLKNGSYIIGVMGKKAYRSSSLYGPWTAIETTFDFIDGPQNPTNRTYVVREDGSVLMMNKEGHLFLSTEANEHFTELPVKRAFVRKNGSHEEDPVMWKDEIEYHLIVNDAIGRVAYHLTSPDGLQWRYEDGIAFDPNIIRHEDGSSENWYKLERPKVLLDNYGRVTYMNFAAIDTCKNSDVANDNHSSKNLIVPLRVPRRLQIVKSHDKNESTKTIKVKILAEVGFDPLREVVIESLRFGGSSQVNYGGGRKAISSYKDGKDLVVLFEELHSTLTDQDYKAKLLGETKDHELLFGFARLK